MRERELYNLFIFIYLLFFIILFNIIGRIHEYEREYKLRKSSVDYDKKKLCTTSRRVEIGITFKSRQFLKN